LSYNQWKRSGKLNATLSVILVGLVAVASALAFVLAIVLGIYRLRGAQPDPLMFLWDRIIAAMLFFWLFGLAAEVQRSELLSLDKLLHLPISLSGAFVLNYFSSLVSLSVIAFTPAMIGLCIALVVTHGPRMLLAFPLVLAFLLLVTGVTYQFRGWLATLMANKRRKRTIVTLVTLSFILLAQVPNLAENYWDKLARDGESGTSPTSTSKAPSSRAADILMIAHLVIPVGWLPYGVRAAAAGSIWPGLLGACGMTLLGSASLWRSYHTTRRFYTGVSERPARAGKAASAAVKPRSESLFLEKVIPGVPERTAAIALAGFRSILRAPEIKMALLTPVICGAVVTSMMWASPLEEFPAEARAYIALGALGVMMLTLGHVVINLFGFDRHGFRTFVLSAVPRHEILAGKNLAVAPLAGLGSLALLILLQVIAPLRTSHFLATLLQIVPTFLTFCVVGNMVSIWAPMAVSTGSLKPLQPKLLTILIQALGMMLAPLSLTPAAIGLGAEVLLQTFADWPAIPVYLCISVVEAYLSVWLYVKIVKAQGEMLQQRETHILPIVASSSE
jgi:hypothetical protein